MEVSEIRAHVQNFVSGGHPTPELEAAFQFHIERLLFPNLLQNPTRLSVERNLEQRAAVLAGIFRKEDDFDRKLAQSSAQPAAFEQERARFKTKTEAFEAELAAALQSLETEQDDNTGEAFLRGLVVKAFDFYERHVLGWKENRSQPAAEQVTPLEDTTLVVRGVKNETLEDLVLCAMKEMSRSEDKARVLRPVIRRYLLTWEAFRQGTDDFQFYRMLQADLIFRDDVLRAAEYVHREARELAKLAVQLLRTTPTTRWNLRIAEPYRSQVIASLAADGSEGELRTLLGAYQDTDPDEAPAWENCQNELAHAFARDPMLSTTLWDAFDWPRPFALVFREELRQIEERREMVGESDGEEKLADRFADVSALAVHKQLFGVAFSGGGIRSATFNLGVLQYLAELKLLRRIDYFSTVSGGGYIGAWLAGRICRTPGISKVQDALSPVITPDPRDPSQKPVKFLREFSNYLTPSLGTVSFDTWTMVAVYTRNLILNQAVLFAVFATILLVPRFLAFPLSKGFCDWHGDLTFLVIATALLFFAVLFMAIDLNAATEIRDAESPAPPAVPPTEGAGTRSGAAQLVPWFAVVLMLLAVYCGSVWMWRSGTVPHQLGKHWDTRDYLAVGLFAFLSLLLSLVGGFWRCYQTRLIGRNYGLSVLVLIMVTALSAMTSFELLRIYAEIMVWLRGKDSLGLWNAALWGPVLLLTVLVIPGILQVGLMGVDFPDSGREWISRFRAVCSVYTVYWIVLFSAAIYGPLLAFWLYRETKIGLSTITLGWLVTTIAGLRAGKSRKTGLDKDKKPTFNRLEVLAKVAPPVFIAGLVILISTLEQLLLLHLRDQPVDLDTLINDHWTLLNPWWASGSLHDGSMLHSGTMMQLLAIFLGFIGAGLILAWRVDINEFSMHHFYKNRLVRCYLGASNQENRRPNLFTGFDENDDFPLSELRAREEGVTSGWRTRRRRKGRAISERRKANRPYDGPYPIINTTLNVSAGDQLAWQERKAESFIFTPCYCGFDVPDQSLLHGRDTNQTTEWHESDVKLKPCGYRVTRDYSREKGPNLGTATSISGAAANPNQGYNTSPTVAFLMTVFDVRLGWWLGNPRRNGPSKLSSPVFGLKSLLNELVGRADDTSKFVNLSDGGHFDNMGIYELIRRRCAFIILCDAEQDPSYSFGGLGMAIRKCRIDFGAEITIDPSRIVPKNGRSKAHCAVGSIKYLDGSKGTLVYIKSSLTGDENEDVLEYHAGAPQFPHETTADQWFSESQFESYRALGYHATKDALTHIKRWIDWNPQENTLTELFGALAKIWYPVNPNLRTSASKHTASLSDMFSMIRSNPGLHDLGAQLFPNSKIKPSGIGNPVGEFYLSMMLLQLVEDLYFELELEREEWFRDPHISGWRYLFRLWKRVPAVQAAWKSQYATFRADFQRFWNNL